MNDNFKELYDFVMAYLLENKNDIVYVNKIPYKLVEAILSDRLLGIQDNNNIIQELYMDIDQNRGEGGAKIEKLVFDSIEEAKQIYREEYEKIKEEIKIKISPIFNSISELISDPKIYDLIIKSFHNYDLEKIIKNKIKIDNEKLKSDILNIIKNML